MNILSNPVVASVFYPLAIGIFIVGVFGGVLKAKKASATPDWPVVEGHILSSKFIRGVEQADIAKVIYEYEVSGQNFQSALLHFGSLFSDLRNRGAKSVVENYPVGTLVKVYYNPKNPSEAVLEHIKRRTIWFTLICELVLIALIIVFMLMWFGGNLMKASG